MPRLPLVPARKAGLLARFGYRLTRRRYGAALEPIQVFAHHRPLLRAYGVFELAAERAMRALPPGLGKLVEFRVATRVGCSWCVDFGTMLLADAGLDVDRLRELDDYRDSPRFTATERRALAYADAMTAQPPTVTDEMVAELDAELGHRGLLELTYAIGMENLRARVNTALGITAQGFTSGDACAVPPQLGQPAAGVGSGRRRAAGR